MRGAFCIKNSFTKFSFAILKFATEYDIIIKNL